MIGQRINTSYFYYDYAIVRGFPSCFAYQHCAVALECMVCGEPFADALCSLDTLMFKVVAIFSFSIFE